MTGWTALVPVKFGAAGKTRLAGLLGAGERAALAEQMARHVLSVLAASRAIERILLLSPHRPDWWSGEWVRDAGRGLNAELMAWRAADPGSSLLVIHADLPLLAVEDVEALLAAAADGVAIATDRAGTGTNALAIAGGNSLDFHFGVDSCTHHAAQKSDIVVLHREGLAADCDTPEDVVFAQSRGGLLDP